MTLSREELVARLNEKGWILAKEGYPKSNQCLAVCIHGHKHIFEKSKSKDLPYCSYCSGMKATLRMVQRKINEQGFSVEDIEQSKVDRSGNTYVPKNISLTLTCSEGHVQRMTVQELFKGKECTACTGTRAQTAYSRSEEIIAGILDHLSIPYIRQAVTDTLHEQLKLDFILPEHKVIIEYDGAHHKYGRTSDRDYTLEEIKRTDAIRDDYAKTIGFKMVRINHYNVGKRLVYTLAELFPTWGINVLDPYYDTLVKTIYDYAHNKFGWDSYDVIKTYADLNQQLGREKAHEKTGRSRSRLQLDYSTVYGKKKKNK